MIDLHSHILPGLDDGASDLAMSLEMARIAVADGIRMMACTPHITPGLYHNDSALIERAISELERVLAAEGLPLELVAGADIHVSPEMGARLAAGLWPRLAGTRYFLFEPPHEVLPPQLFRLARRLMDRGFVPVLTHPERLAWIERRYDVICELARSGAVVQLTAGSVTGEFGRRAQYWSERLLDEGRVDLLASDAHNASARPPVLSHARDEVARQFGEEMAWRMVLTNPRRILRDEILPETTTAMAGALHVEERSGLRLSQERRCGPLIC